MLPNSTGAFVIDVNRSIPPGNLCFLPVLEASGGEPGINHELSSYGPIPPDPSAEILGYVYEGPMDLLDRWERENEPWLSKLNIRRN